MLGKTNLRIWDGWSRRRWAIKKVCLIIIKAAAKMLIRLAQLTRRLIKTAHKFALLLTSISSRYNFFIHIPLSGLHIECTIQLNHLSI